MIHKSLSVKKVNELYFKFCVFGDIFQEVIRCSIFTEQTEPEPGFFRHSQTSSGSLTGTVCSALSNFIQSL